MRHTTSHGKLSMRKKISRRRAAGLRRMFLCKAPKLMSLPRMWIILGELRQVRYLSVASNDKRIFMGLSKINRAVWRRTQRLGGR